MNFHKIQQRSTLHQRKNLVNRQLPPLTGSAAPTDSNGSAGNGNGNGNGNGGGNGQNTSINLSRTVDQGPTSSSTSTTSTSSSAAAASTSSSSQAASAAATSSGSTTAAQTTAKAATAAANTIINPTGSLTHGVTSLTTTQTLQPTASQSSAPSSGTNVGGLVGSIGGGMLGVAAVGFIIFFIVKRYRKKQDEDDVFDAGEFRKSAVMLDDDAINANIPRNPRPPTMIERHVAGPAINNYQYGDQGQYSQYPNAGYGGAYGQAMGYGGYEQSQYPQQQFDYNNGDSYDAALPNPFGEGAAPVGAMGYDGHDPASPTNSSPVLSRQPSQHAIVEHDPAYAHSHHNSGEYVEMDRGAPGPAPRGPLPSAGQPRPISANTVYSPEDAYGGM